MVASRYRRLAGLKIPSVSLSMVLLVLVPWSLVLAMCLRVQLLPRVPEVDRDSLTELQFLKKHLQSHLALYGEYPPDFSTGDPAKEIRDHLKKRFPLRYHAEDLPDGPVLKNLGPHNALHFWFESGLCFNNQYYPITGEIDAKLLPMTDDEIRAELEQSTLAKVWRKQGGGSIESAPGYSQKWLELKTLQRQKSTVLQFVTERTLRFDFSYSRISNGGQYRPKCCEAPYVYFRNDNYDTASFVGENEWGVAQPYLSDESTAEARRYIKPNGYQVVCAGSDGRYGLGSISVSAGAFDESHGDNIVSFLDQPLGMQLRQEQRAWAIKQRNATPLLAIVCLLIYPLLIALRVPEDGIVALSRSIRRQSAECEPSHYWVGVLNRQRHRFREAAIKRMKSPNSDRNQKSDEPSRKKSA